MYFFGFLVGLLPFFWLVFLLKRRKPRDFSISEALENWDKIRPHDNIFFPIKNDSE